MENEQDPGLHHVPSLLCLLGNQCDVRRSNHILSCICLTQSQIRTMGIDQKPMPEAPASLATPVKGWTCELKSLGPLKWLPSWLRLLFANSCSSWWIMSSSLEGRVLPPRPAAFTESTGQPCHQRAFQMRPGLRLGWHPGSQFPGHSWRASGTRM